MRRFLVAAMSAVVLIAGVPAVTAFAGGSAPLECSLTLAVLFPGTDTVTGNIIVNTGQEVVGSLNCNLDQFDGVIKTRHGSITGFNSKGWFAGGLRGTFTVDTALRERLDGHLNAGVIGLMDVPGVPLTALFEAIRGKWDMAGPGFEGSGTFSIVMTPIPRQNPVTLGGAGELTGEVTFR